MVEIVVDRGGHVRPNDRPGVLQNSSCPGSDSEYAKASFDVGDFGNRL
jgi:hypothetical protein